MALTLGHDRWDGRPALVRPYLYSVNVAASATEPISGKTWLDVGGDIGTRLQTDYFTPPLEMSSAVEEYKRTDLMAGAWVDLTYVATERTTFTTGARLDM